MPPEGSPGTPPRPRCRRRSPATSRTRDPPSSGSGSSSPARADRPPRSRGTAGAHHPGIRCRSRQLGTAPVVSYVLPVPGEGLSVPTGTVTLFFSDVVGSTRLWADHPEAMSAALRIHDQILTESIAKYHGH